MESAIYQGIIRHRRFKPVVHEFTYRMFMMYLDLDELDEVFSGSRLFSTQGRALAEFRRSDHFGDPRIPLKEAVNRLVEKRAGFRPDGPIRILTHLRYFGYVFNPVSFYYCFDRQGKSIVAVVAEVNNTPWGEQHCYVLNTRNQASSGEEKPGAVLRFEANKAMHVSPFMPMDLKYDWRIGSPRENLTLHMSNLAGETKLFDATLRLTRKVLTPSSLAFCLATFPFMTVKVMLAIHWQALKLWLKKVPFHPHPALEADDAVQHNSSQ